MADQAFNIDFDFLRQQEGYKNRIYVPTCTLRSVRNQNNRACFGKKEGSVIGKSGPTVGGGIDLGQRNEYDLKRAGVRKDLIRKLTPLLLKRGSEALSAVETFNKSGVPLSPKEVKELDNAVKTSMARNFARKYQNDTGRTFQQLPAGIQTALFSLFYQYGIHAMERYQWAKNLWDHVKKNAWPSVIQAYQDLAKIQGFASRRKAEWELIQQALPQRPH